MKPNNQLKTWLSQAGAFLSPASDKEQRLWSSLSAVKAIHHQAKIKNLKIQPEGTCKYPVLSWHFDWWPPLLISASCLWRFPKNWSLVPTPFSPTIICLCGETGTEAGIQPYQSLSLCNHPWPCDHPPFWHGALALTFRRRKHIRSMFLSRSLYQEAQERKERGG